MAVVSMTLSSQAYLDPPRVHIGPVPSNLSEMLEHQYLVIE
jgi:hypothetical protein